MIERQLQYDSFKLEMENVGFVFEKTQWPHHQKRIEMELKFCHPDLIKKWKDEGYNVRAKKFYIKPLLIDANLKIGFVTGKSSPLNTEKNFTCANSQDPHDNNPAWINKNDDPALDYLLKSVKDYLD